MSELWAKWKHRLIFGACAWVLLAFIFLSASVDHPLFSTQTATKIYKTTSDIVLLKWVTKYQTLLAGFAALVGGAFVIVANREQIHHLRNSKKQERLDQALDTFYAIGTEFGDYYRLRREKNDNVDPLIMPETPLLRDIAYISPQLVQHLIRVHKHSVNFSNKSKNSSAHLEKNNKILLIYSFCLFQMFRQIGRHVAIHDNFAPRLQLKDFKFDSKPIERIAEEFNLEQKHLGRFSPFFKIEDNKPIIPSNPPAASAAHQPKS